MPHQIDAEDSLVCVHQRREIATACSRAWTTCRTSPRLVGGRRQHSKHAERAGRREQPVALPQRIPADGVEDQFDSPSTYDLSRPRFKVLGSVIDQLIIADGLAFAKLLGRPASRPTSPDIDKDFLNPSFSSRSSQMSEGGFGQRQTRGSLTRRH
jgi:hypothetical protein